MHTATWLKNTTKNPKTHAALYQLRPALEGHEYVVASASSLAPMPVTDLFAADKSGTVTDWLGLAGLTNVLSHAKLLSECGYKLLDRPTLCAFCGTPFDDPNRPKCEYCGGPNNA